MSMLQAQARALGDPTRHAIFRYIADADHASDIAELTAHLSLNHNAIRQHLAKLVAANLIVEAKAPRTTRGRPRLVYVVHPAADSRWGVVGPYERLSVLLAEVLRTGDSPEEVGRRYALQARGPTLAQDPVAQLGEDMDRHGFEPETLRRGDRTEIVLQRCPFESAALTDPDTVCQLHLGIAEGFAELSGGRIVVEQLMRRDPRRAGCRMRVKEATPPPEPTA
jgi:predicted ArsR family transcriptional regulator